MSSRKSHRNKQASGTEYCPGFVDQHGMWNNGFYCPKWGGPDIQYCCGTEKNKYCCPKEHTQHKLHGDQTQQISLLIGLAVGSFVLLMATLVLSCYFCRCCWAYKRRKRLQGPVLPAYPGLMRDLSDPINYAVCPHGTVYPEFMRPAPPYPADDPPPYPGHEPALPLEDKRSLPLQHSLDTGQETCLDNQTNVTHDRPHQTSLQTHEYTNPRCNHSDTVARETNLQSAVIPHDSPTQSQSDNDTQLSRRSGQLAPNVIPSTSRHTCHGVPKFKSSYGHGRSKKHCPSYDRRSITSSDSDSGNG